MNGVIAMDDISSCSTSTTCFGTMIAPRTTCAPKSQPSLQARYANDQEALAGYLGLTFRSSKSAI
jgi:hypothetical protein